MNSPQNTIALPQDLLEEAARVAESRGVDVTAWVSECVRASLPQAPPSGAQATHVAQTDPLFADAAVFEDDGPGDFAERHDDYLYGPLNGGDEADASQ